VFKDNILQEVGSEKKLTMASGDQQSVRIHFFSGE
jgi:hypothetical protein